jgi:hypothetical protein
MKTLNLLVFLFLSASAFGKIWVVDSNTGSSSKDFTSLNAACNAASSGDTLYVIGSPNNYLSGKITLNKKIIIIGPGYFLNENPNTQASLSNAHVFNGGTCGEIIEFAAGSEGAAIMGMTFYGRMTVTTNNILIKRNFFSDGQPSCSQERITISGSNIIISQNYVGGPSQGYGILVNTGYSNVLIKNNVIINYQFNAGDDRITCIAATGSSLEVSNNILFGAVITSNSLIQNNILPCSNVIEAPGSVIRNNLSTANQLPTGNGNVNNLAASSLFEGPGSTDGQWKLKAGSPALGAGFGGVDDGIFGGPEPYVLSGIPPIPTIYSLTAPSVGEKNTGLPLQIKVKSNN